MFRFCLLLLLITSLTSCSSILAPQQQPVMQSYTLTSVSKIKPRGAKSQNTLLVSRTTGSSNLQSQDMLYVTKLYSLEPFTKNQWSATPAQMFFPLLVQSLQNSQHFRAVVTPPFSGKDNIQLNTQVITLQQEFLQNPSRIKMEVNAELINSQSERVIASKRFFATAKAPQNNPYGGVVAANAASRQILQQIVTFVASHSR